MSRRYQSGCLYREPRNAGPDVWVFRWRDGQVNRKEKVGTLEQFPTRTKALKACELLRANINREARSPRNLVELISHYQQHELPNKTPYTGEVYKGYLKTWILPKWGEYKLSDVRTVAVEFWLGKLPLANGTGEVAESHARNFQSRDAAGIFRPQPDHPGAAISQAQESAERAHA